MILPVSLLEMQAMIFDGLLSFHSCMIRGEKWGKPYIWFVSFYKVISILWVVSTKLLVKSFFSVAICSPIHESKVEYHVTYVIDGGYLYVPAI